MHGLRFAELGTADLAQPEKANLALADQLSHRPNRLGQRHVGVAAMHVVEVDHLDPEPGQAGLHRLANVGAVVADDNVPVLVLGESELGGHRHRIPVALDERGDEFLVLAEAVEVCRVEQRHPVLDCGLQRVL